MGNQRGESFAGLVAYGSYVPRHRLKRSEIAAVLGAGGGKGTRSVAAFDEDAASMAVEAARPALRDLPADARPERLLFATTNPPYLDKTNAAVIHAALRLDPSVLAIDVIGSVRSGVGALVMAAESRSSTLVVLSDIRTGAPGGADEREGGDGAAAFVFGGEGEPIAEVLAEASVTDEFLDRWRLPGALASKTWEERFGEHVYVPLAEAAFGDALKKAGITASEVDVLVVAGTHRRAVRAFGAAAGAARLADDLSTSVGDAGAASPGLLLANVLDTAEPGQTIALVVLSDGATAILLRTTEALTAARRTPTVGQQITEGDDSTRYADFLSWRGFLPREQPRRPDPIGPAAPPTHRSAHYKYGFVAHRCDECGTIHLPAVRVCINCKAIDHMTELSMAEQQGTIATFSIDHLAFSLNPPVVLAVVDLDGGGRFSCELADVHPDRVAIGDRVDMTFRRLVTASEIHNYFWKARPIAAEEDA
jgi:3-hydroxy-3-methylglutaryl CoA synthase